MRPILQSDVAAAARVLLHASPGRRLALAVKLLEEAEAADRYARRLGKPHPVWGNGTLLAAARRYPLAPERAWNDPVFLSCLRCVLKALHGHRQQRKM